MGIFFGVSPYLSQLSTLSSPVTSFNRQFSWDLHWRRFVVVCRHSIHVLARHLTSLHRSTPKGLAARYASWRDMQYALLACGLLAVLAVLLFLPETSHPLMRGIDKVRMMDEESSDGERGRGNKGWRLVWLNPLSCLGLLRSPNLLIVVSTFPVYSDLEEIFRC